MCYKAADTAGYFVRLRETSAACMRLEEEAEAEAEDGTLLMLMRELSVSVTNIGGLTARRWRFSAVFSDALGLIVGSGEGSCDGRVFETRAAGELDEDRTVSSRHSSGLSCY